MVKTCYVDEKDILEPIEDGQITIIPRGGFVEVFKKEEVMKEIEDLKKIKVGDNCSPEGIKDLFLDGLKKRLE